jgi:hypothetical protein
LGLDPALGTHRGGRGVLLIGGPVGLIGGLVVGAISLPPLRVGCERERDPGGEPHDFGTRTHGPPLFMLGDVTIQRMDNIAIVVEDLDGAVAFFTELGMELESRGRSKAFGRIAPSDSKASGAKSR